MTTSSEIIGSTRPSDVGHRFATAINCTLTRVKGLGSKAGAEALAPNLDAQNPLEIAGLLAGHSSEYRRRVVGEWLTHNQVDHIAQAFKTFECSGVNYIIPLRLTTKNTSELIIFAHHDPAPGSCGANDNASSVGVALSAIKAGILTARPGLDVTVVITDHEERAYAGARQFIRNLSDDALSKITLAVSLEMVGVGDTIVLADAGPKGDKFQQILFEHGIRCQSSGPLRSFASDHHALSHVEALVMAVMPSSSSDALAKFAKNPLRAFAGMVGITRCPTPFDTYHTKADSLETLEPDALDLASRAIVHLLDAVELT